MWVWRFGAGSAKGLYNMICTKETKYAKHLAHILDYSNYVVALREHSDSSRMLKNESSFTSSSAIAERPGCRVSELWPKVEDWNWETIFMDIIGLYSTTVTV